MIDYAVILTRRYQGRQWTLNANDYQQLTMLDGENKPSQKSLDDAWPEVQAEIAAEQAAANAAAMSGRAKPKALGLRTRK